MKRRLSARYFKKVRKKLFFVSYIITRCINMLEQAAQKNSYTFSHSRRKKMMDTIIYDQAESLLKNYALNALKIFFYVMPLCLICKFLSSIIFPSSYRICACARHGYHRILLRYKLVLEPDTFT